MCRFGHAVKREISVPVHGNRSLGIGLERKLLKLAGLRKGER